MDDRWYVVLHPKPDAKEGSDGINFKYANVLADRWRDSRRMATHWLKREDAEEFAMRLIIKKPEYIQRIEAMSFPRQRRRQ